MVSTAVIGISCTHEGKRRERICILLGTRIQEAATCRETVSVVDMPLQISHQRARLTLHITSAHAAAIITSQGTITLRDAIQLILLQSHAIAAPIIRGWRATHIKLATYKVEEFILHHCSAQRHTIYLRGLILQLFSLLHITPWGSAVEILIVEIAVCRALKLVCSRLGDSIDSTATKTAHSHIIRSHHNIQLLNGIERHGVSTRQAAVSARRRQAIHIVIGYSVDHKRVIAVRYTTIRDTATLCRHSLWHQSHHIIQRA